MIADSSALVSIFLEEPGSEQFVETILRADVALVGAPVALETAIVLSWRLRQDVRVLVAELFQRLNVEITDFSEIHYNAALTAFMRFGKGRHPAALNFGDCMSYALAKVSGLPLLYSGKDFSHTDIQSA